MNSLVSKFFIKIFDIFNMKELEKNGGNIMEDYDNKDLFELLDMCIKMTVRDLKMAIIRPKGSRFITAGIETSLLSTFFLIPVALISYILSLLPLHIGLVAKLITYPVIIMIGIGIFSIFLGMFMSAVEWMNEAISNDDDF